MDAYDARTHLRSLRGQLLHTAGRDRPNRVLSVSNNEVVVATDRAPQGEAVPIDWVQAAGERLLAERELRITPAEIGYRSAFIGAVLRTIPGVTVHERPLTLRLSASRALLTNWAQPTWRRLEREGLQGKPLRHTAGGEFRRRGLQAGDAVYVVGQEQGQLMLIGRLNVDAVVDQDQAEDELGEELYDAPDHVIGRAPWTVARFDRIVPEAIARKLRMEDGTELAFESDREYRLAGQALRTDRWLASHSAATLDRLLDNEPPTSEEEQLVEDVVRGRRRGGDRLTAAAKRAVEQHAMTVTAAWLRADGWTVADTSATRPYDFLATRGTEQCYVEVKGTTGDGAAVTVTAGEVDHARAHPDHCLLAVVSEILLDVRDSTRPTASGGTFRYATPWRPAPEQLAPIAYRHTVPTLERPSATASRRRCRATTGIASCEVVLTSECARCGAVTHPGKPCRRRSLRAASDSTRTSRRRQRSDASPRHQRRTRPRDRPRRRLSRRSPSPSHATRGRPPRSSARPANGTYGADSPLWSDRGRGDVLGRPGGSRSSKSRGGSG